MSAAPADGGSAEQSEAIGASWRTQVRIFNTRILCPDSSLWVNFLLLHYSHSDFYNRSRMTGRYLISFRKKPFSCLLTLAPSDGWRRHLSQRQSVSLTFTASLCSSKSGSLASRQAGTAFGEHSAFCTKPSKSFEEMQLTSAVILERRIESEWWQEKRYHVTLSEESGKGYRQKRI